MQPNLTVLRSAIYADDAVDNAFRRFGAAKRYYVAELVMEGGAPVESAPLLFTQGDIDAALERAAANPEDVQTARENAAEPGSDTWIITGTLMAIALCFGMVLGAWMAGAA